MKLNEREIEVMKWMSEGKTAWEIGTILGVSPRTIEWRSKSAQIKMCASNITHAIAMCVRRGVIGIYGTGMCALVIRAAIEAGIFDEHYNDFMQIFLAQIA